MNVWVALIGVAIYAGLLFGGLGICNLIQDWRFRREGRDLADAFGYWTEHMGEPGAELRMEIARRNASHDWSSE